MKKTFKVEDLVQYVNMMLSIREKDAVAYPQLASREYKEAMCDVVEKVMSRAKCYGGYQLLEVTDAAVNDRNSADFWTRRYIIKKK